MKYRKGRQACDENVTEIIPEENDSRNGNANVFWWPVFSPTFFCVQN